ncbi:aspartate ammonia-lyase [Timonella senegalensis]|uniref:aspartate ammonia-lyase n=1 Tax=Timonella senegalensis TaxID=1465825 RepID=UPI00031E6AF6|nr:aspartate ammonia-lyase [Timonella senegalensis]
MARQEKDLLGYRDIPDNAYWGVQTLRAVENFPITGLTIQTHPNLIKGLAAVKLACARTNQELGILPSGVAEPIIAACQRIMAGELHDQFIVDVIQGGAGTSTNMNANEVIANLALEIIGETRGNYAVINPNDHVNLSQSTNDIYPTALKIALLYSIVDLRAAMAHLQAAFAAKSREFYHVLKMGRTQLQDAVPMTLGQEFGAFAIMIGEDRDRITEVSALLTEINLGATAIGTGINAPEGYAALAAEHLSEITGFSVSTAADLVEATQDVGSLVQTSGTLKRVAVKLSKICNDLRLLSSGPRAGFGEINLPAMQAGSSIMPGKVNPVIPEVVSQVAYEVIGNDVAISMAAEAGQLQLNAFEPVIFHKLDAGINHLTAACYTLADRCVSGITANEARLKDMVEHSIGLATALNPILGYSVATGIAAEALVSGRGVAEIVNERGLMTPEQLAEVLSPTRLANLRPLPGDPTATGSGAETLPHSM